MVNVNNIILVILIILRLMIGLRLVITGVRNRLTNLMWLSVSMLVTIFILLVAAVDGNPLAAQPYSLWVSTIGSIIGQGALIVFNQLTFYKDRKSPVVLWIWIVFGVLSAIALYGVTVSESNFKPSIWVAASSPCTVIIWSWHGLLAYRALSQIASEITVEDWVKSRYRLIVAYSIVLTIGGVASIVRNFFAGGSVQSSLGGALGTVTGITQIVSVTLLFLVWVMPEAFRQWLNRNYQKRLDEKVYEQALAIMDILGTSMSQGTTLPKTLALVGIRKTISKELATEDSKQIEAHVAGLGYDEWSRFLNKPDLQVFIKEVANANPQQVLENARNALIENQSLFTVQAK